MADISKRLHAIVSGLVQGVNYRYYTTLKAEELNIVGWVHNRKDGKVEVVAEGKEATLKEFELWLHEGSPHANVETVEVTWGEASEEFNDFETLYVRDFDTY